MTNNLARVRANLWNGVLAAAATRVANGEGDTLVVLPSFTPDEDWHAHLHAAAQHDDDVSALAAIDVLRILVAQYEDEGSETGAPVQPAEGELVATCPDHPQGDIQLTETGYTRSWDVAIDDSDGTTRIFATGDRVDWESGNGDDHFECRTCLRRLGDVVDFADVDYS